MPNKSFKQWGLHLTRKYAIRIYSWCTQRLSPSLRGTKGYEIRENFQSQCQELKDSISIISLLFRELLDVDKDNIVQLFKSIASMGKSPEEKTTIGEYEKLLVIMLDLQKANKVLNDFVVKVDEKP